MIVFLDFDGVVHPEGTLNQEDLFCRLPLIEEVFREFPDVAIVISSAWRLEYRDPGQALVELRGHFSQDIAPRVVGVTADHRKLDSNQAPDGLYLFTRHWECEMWMRTNRPPGTPWLALDDRSYLFRPFCSNLLRFDPNVACTHDHADELRERLARLSGLNNELRVRP